MAVSIAAGVLVAWTLIRAGRVLAGERRGARRVNRLSRLGRLQRSRGVEEVWVPGAPRLCHAAGWWRPRVLVSESLRRVVATRELDAALAHEHAHLRRRDPLAIVILRVVGACQPPGFTRAAERCFREEAEMAA